MPRREVTPFDCQRRGTQPSSSSQDAENGLSRAHPRTYQQPHRTRHASRCPRIVHGTLLLLGALLAAALLWSAATKADLVVRALGRVRPMSSPMKVVYGGSGAVLSASMSGQVIEVNVRKGDEVRQDDVLIRLDTERMDLEMTKRRRAIQVGEDELAEMDRREQLLAHQFAAARAGAAAELAQVQEEVCQAKDRQVTDIRLAGLELQNAQQEAAHVRQLVARGIVPRDDLRKAMARVHEAQEKFDKARFLIDTGKVEVLRRALTQVTQDDAVRRQELQTEQGLKRAAIEVLQIELANLVLERQQAVIRAPIHSIVTMGDVKVGDVLDRSKPVVEIAEQQGFRFEVESEELGRGDL